MLNKKHIEFVKKGLKKIRRGKQEKQLTDKVGPVRIQVCLMNVDKKTGGSRTGSVKGNLTKAMTVRGFKVSEVFEALRRVLG